MILCLLLIRKVMTNLDSLLKSRDITLTTKVRLVKGMVFPVVMYGCESWTIKKAECRRIDAFELWCWRRLLRVPWTARRSNQSILKEISPLYSLEGLTLKLKLQYFGHLTWRTDSFEKTLMLGKIESRRRRGQQRTRWLDGITEWTWIWVNSRSWWWTGRPSVHRVAESNTTEQLNWTDDFTGCIDCCCSIAKLCLTLCDPMDCSTPGFAVFHYLLEFAQTHVHLVGDAISSSITPFSSWPQSFPASRFVPICWLFASCGQNIELQLQHQSFQWIYRVDLFWNY